MAGWRRNEPLGDRRVVDITEGGSRRFPLEIDWQEPKPGQTASRIEVGVKPPSFIYHLGNTNVPSKYPKSFRAQVQRDGYSLREAQLAYETFGVAPKPDGSNVVVVVHALTGDSHVFGSDDGLHPTPGWWGDDAGSNSVIDLTRHHVICFNNLGGCQGSTGPTSTEQALKKIEKETRKLRNKLTRKGDEAGAKRVTSDDRSKMEKGRDGFVDVGDKKKSWWHPDFPVITIRDMARAQLRALSILARTEPGYRKFHVVGGSMGAQIALEMAIMAPERMHSATLISGNSYTHPVQSAWHRAIDRQIRRSPDEGMKDAREFSMLLFQSLRKLNGRETHGYSDRRANGERDIESWLNYQSRSFEARFDPASLIVLHRAMALHDIGGAMRPSRDWAASRITCPVLVLGSQSDMLFRYNEQEELFSLLQDNGVNVRLETIKELDRNNPSGHDAFLIDTPSVKSSIESFLQYASRNLDHTSSLRR